MATLIAGALTTLDDVKETMGIEASDQSWDSIIIRKINQVTRQIENYCGRTFALGTYTEEVYNATHTDQLILKNRPIVGDVTLEARDTVLNEDDFETIDSELLFVDSGSGVLNLNFGAIGHWGAYRVTYTAGYSTIPEDLAEAAATLAAYYTLNADASQIGVKEIQEGQRRKQFGDNNTNLSFDNILSQLGIDQIIAAYANYPILADR